MERCETDFQEASKTQPKKTEGDPRIHGTRILESYPNYHILDQRGARNEAKKDDKSNQRFQDGLGASKRRTSWLRTPRKSNTKRKIRNIKTLLVCYHPWDSKDV